MIPGNAGELCIETQRLAGGEKGVVHGHFRQVTDALPRASGAGRLTKNAHLALLGFEETHQDFDGGGFARAVWANETHHFALFN